MTIVGFNQGKPNVKNVENGEKKQTRVLTDYLRNLHNKYKCENPSVDISLSTFGRLRPKHVLLAAFISRNTCQCIHHQNMALKVQAMRKCGIKISENPENLIVHADEMDTLLANLPAMVAYKTWKKVTLENGRTKIKVVDVECEAERFRDDMKTQTHAFIQHVHRVREQYQQIRVLKENIKEHEVIVQMDYAEKFSCRSLDEIQTAYWNQTGVTIFPVVAYFKKNNELQHQSFVFISDEVSHSAGTVKAFIDELIPALKEIDNEIRMIHYWIDSPSSQFRNRFIFYLIANHAALYGITCRWNYFEVGHGKGPCDGFGGGGGTCKRLADEAIRQGRAVIQDASEFFAWAIKSSMNGVRFIYVSSEQTQSKHAELNNIKAKPLHQTMKVHAVGATSNSTKLMSRETSCYCNVCIGGSYCEKWTVQNFKWTNAASLRDQQIVEEEVPLITETENSAIGSVDASNDGRFKHCLLADLSVCDYIAAVYEGKWYVGKIEEIDLMEKDCEVNFMTNAKQLFKWPESPDLIWIDETNILCKVTSLTTSRKSKRLYKLDIKEKDAIKDNFLKLTSSK